ncbi:MAG: aminodeoxychorismate lyase, partial [Gammaproteobacteria bacterium]|nr:aminodeoxychorismate lyase [Gammaproteobacteria bacterium]
TLIEGWNSQQILAALANKSAITHTLAGLNSAEIKGRLGIKEPNLEGLFYPDTYHFVKGTTDLAFLLRAYTTLQNYLQAEWAARQANLPYQTPYQALIAASLIEKEAKLREERPLISGIIVKRLQNNMRLQIDASVIYGLGENYTGKLRRRDMQIDTPYNTYLYKGLPPTPIAIPSLASIHAALHPVITDNIFYVSRGDGGHYFSADLANHNKAIQQFLLKKPAQQILMLSGDYSMNLFNINGSTNKFCAARIN